MSVEGRGWATRVGIDLANWRQEEPTGFDGRRQLSRGGTSRVSREAQARICERLGVKFPGPTRHCDAMQNGVLEAAFRPRYSGFHPANGDEATAAIVQ